MSKREKISADLSAYLDGELSQARRGEIEKVLQYDKDLAGELERLKATRRLIGDLPGENPPADFVHRVVARGERMHLLGRRRTNLYWWMPTASAAAAVLLAAAGAVTIIFHQHQAGSVEHGEEPMVTLAIADKEIDRDDKFARTVDAAPEEEVAPVLAPLSEGRRLAKKEAPAKAGELAYKGKRGKSAFAPTLPPSPQNVDIYTDNLALAQRDVINVLAANNIQRQTHITEQAGDLSNVFQTNIETTRQVQYIAFVPANQMGKLRKELNSVIARQNVTFLAKRSSTTMPTTRVAGRLDVQQTQQALQQDNVKLTITLNLNRPSPPAAPAADEKK